MRQERSQVSQISHTRVAVSLKIIRRWGKFAFSAQKNKKSTRSHMVSFFFLALASAHLDHSLIYILHRQLCLSLSISLYVLLTKWNEQTYWPNMLHHTEREGGLS